MKKSSWMLLMAVIGCALIGLWTMNAYSEDPPPNAPPPDDDWMPLMGSDLPLGGGPPAGAPGQGGQGMRRRPIGPGMGQDGMMNNRRQQEMERIKTEDPQRYQRLMKIKELALEYRSSNDENRKKEIEKELRVLVDQELKIQHQNNKKRVEDLERRVKHMKQVLKDREDHWDEVVDYTVKEITGQNDYLKAWRGGPRGPNPPERRRK